MCADVVKTRMPQLKTFHPLANRCVGYILNKSVKKALCDDRSWTSLNMCGGWVVDPKLPTTWYHPVDGLTYKHDWKYYRPENYTCGRWLEMWKTSKWTYHRFIFFVKADESEFPRFFLVSGKKASVLFVLTQISHEGLGYFLTTWSIFDHSETSPQQKAVLTIFPYHEKVIFVISCKIDLNPLFHTL